MNLSDLGLDEWFQARVGDSCQAGQGIARVTAVDRGAYLVRNELREVPAELTGKFRFQVAASADLPCVGDWVIVQYHNSNTSAIIHGVLPRKTFLHRKRAGESVDFQMIAANIDIAFIVQSCHYDFNLRRLDRYLITAADGGVTPMLLLTKTDLVPPDVLQQTLASIQGAGIVAGVLALSNLTGDGFDEFRRLLAAGRTYCLLGSSGVGKTTLINRLVGHDTFDTQAVSATGEGVHTTARRHLIVLEQGAMIIDTPGIRELGILDAADGVAETFDDVHDLSLKCRFTNCSHTQEPGCAVLEAVANGTLSEARLANYAKLKKESEFHAMSYVDKRQKDKAFGRFVKSVKKQMRE